MAKKSFFSFPKAAVINSGCRLDSPRAQWGKKNPRAPPLGTRISFIRGEANHGNSLKSFLGSLVLLQLFWEEFQSHTKVESSKLIPGVPGLQQLSAHDQSCFICVPTHFPPPPSTGLFQSKSWTSCWCLGIYC